MNFKFPTSILLIIFLWLGTCLISLAAPYDVYAVKTAFLFRSLHYVEWPSDQMTDGKNITICFTDTNQFTDTLASLDQRAINDRTIVLKNIASYNEMNSCHVIYIAANPSRPVSAIVSDLRNSNILTVSDQAGFSQSGVILNFPVVDEKVTVEINIDAANEQNIRFSAKLLRIAKLYGKE